MHKNVFGRLAISVLLLCLAVLCRAKSEDIKTGSTELAKEPDSRLLLFATISGNLIAVEQQSGDIRWSLQDHPTVQVPVDTSEAIVPLFLPDPKDGSLYLLGGEGSQILKKLPFTIPQLVASSPCRSSDGILYTGKKKDTWFIMDPETGARQKVVGFDRSGPTCPVATANGIYVGRTQYTIMMIDSKAERRHWNVTFYDYTSSPMTKEMLSDYELAHFTASSTGRVVTLDRRLGKTLWKKDFGSPVVAIYILDPDGFLQVPFSSLAHDTLTHLSEHFSVRQHSLNTQLAHMPLYPTLYIGEHVHGLYALPSLVDQNTVTISASRSGPLLLEGPNFIAQSGPQRGIPIPGSNVRLDLSSEPYNFQSIREQFPLVIILGYYNVPEYSPTRLQIAGKVVTPEEDVKNDSEASDENNKSQRISVAIQTDDTYANNIVKKAYKAAKHWIDHQDNKGLKLTLIVLFGCLVAMFWYMRVQVREFQQLSQSGSRGSQISWNGSATATLEEFEDGTVQIGKIMFYPDQLLGKGCDGTFVYKGQFDKRDVAVKRLLPECFTFADREVSLLRESDQHPNVIRYYCTEQDRQFRYIALELCAATLQDYVQGRYDVSLIAPLTILHQATSGLSHLHSLDIVHRDIKPQNVLLSTPDQKGQVRAMISDFGLCKKLQLGRMSFSRRSGLTGTDGWIAPEMLNDISRTTCAVDMFSLGCLFYYVLSEGKHPFGEPLRRQANILSSEYHLNEIKGDDMHIELARLLISKMISADAESRPPASSILVYPLFWENSRVLAFLQDVSDRVEKAENDDPVLLSLEKDGLYVVRTDWRRHIDSEVAQDLRKYRNYKGDSVRDLLRALRNKKHHYRELTLEAQHSLGEIPGKFTQYWTSRFPLLLLHSWLSMQCIKQEPNFIHYYDISYTFSETTIKDACYSLSQYELEEQLNRDIDDAEEPATQFNDNLWRKQKSNNNSKYARRPFAFGYGRNNMRKFVSKKQNEEQPKWSLLSENKKVQ